MPITLELEPLRLRVTNWSSPGVAIEVASHLCRIALSALGTDKGPKRGGIEGGAIERYYMGRLDQLLRQSPAPTRLVFHIEGEAPPERTKVSIWQTGRALIDCGDTEEVTKCHYVLFMACPPSGASYALLFCQPLRGTEDFWRPALADPSDPTMMTVVRCCTSEQWAAGNPGDFYRFSDYSTVLRTFWPDVYELPSA